MFLGTLRECFISKAVSIGKVKMANVLDVYRKAGKIAEELAQTVRILKPKDRLPLCAQVLIEFLINCDVFSQRRLIDLLKLRQDVLFPKGCQSYWGNAKGNRIRSKKDIRRLNAMDKRDRELKVKALRAVEKKLRAA